MRPWRGGLAVAFLTVFALLLILPAAPAAPDRAAPQASPAKNTRAYQVTLVTGDRLVLTVLANGKQAVTVADRADGGAAPSFHAVEQDGDLYVWPVDLGAYVDTLLDRELFNVSKLVRQGYGDKASSSIPVIVDYGSGLRSRPLPGVAKTRPLRTIGAVAGRELKAHAGAFGRALERQLRIDAPAIEKGQRRLFARTGPFAGVKTIYLDEKVTASLAQSVPQIGAPQAWAAGFDGTGVDVAVLDTGIDASHPDLQGQVVAEANFTPEPTAADGNGHGTHVAATVAGTGAGSAGLRKGVAPGADLLNGKVLDSTGNGQVSWAISAMDWAATNGAEVISMSLQAGFSDGTDPFSQAVNQLTQDRGVLFTIAAGNFGSGAQTVTIPGIADLALSVGAVTKSDVLAGFSGRGPRLGNYAIKPDITAPGVDIIAARAAGTSLGTPVDALYTMLSGTSMATPHVAGAAAILKQEFPFFTPAQLKAAVVSTATPGPYTVYEQGGGRVDVARAYAQKVYALNAPVDFGYFPYPHDADQPVTKTLSYANHTAADVSLNLTVDVTGEGGISPTPGMITTSASSVTVPAGGTASVDVTVDTRIGDPSLYGGAIRAQTADGAVVVRTPVGFYKEPVRYNLTVDGIARDGRPAQGISWIEIVNADDTTKFQQNVAPGTTVRVAPGTYSVMGMLFTYDEPQVYALEAAVAGDPELEVNQDTTYVADARKATEVVVDTDRPTEPKHWVIGTYRAGEDFGSWESLLLASPPIKRMFAASTEQVTKGDFGFRAKPNLQAPELEAWTAPRTAAPLELTYATGAPKVDGTKTLDLVYAGYGRVQDFQGKDVSGKAVLVSRGPLPPVGDPITFVEKVANATAAGAELLIVHNHSPGLLLIGLASADIPVFSLSQAQGLELRARLEQGKKTTLTLKGIPVSPYVYDAIVAERGRILDTHRLTMNGSNSVRIDAAYHAQVPSWLAGEARHAYPPWSGFSFDGARNFDVPVERKEMVRIGDSRWLHVAWGSMTNEHVFEWGQQDPVVAYPRAERLAEDWFGAPQHPNVIKTWGIGDLDEPGEPIIREGNTITAFVPSFVDAFDRWGLHDSRTDNAPFQLYENGALIAESQGFFGSYGVSGSPASYRAELDVTRTAPYWTQSTGTHTTWTFASAPPAGGGREILPILVVDYDLPGLDLQNRAQRGTQKIELFPHRQVGAAGASIARLTLSVSYDDGATWSPVPVSRLSNGRFRALIQNPPSGPAEHVSLRVQATDSGGSGIDQTVVRAYGLVD